MDGRKNGSGRTGEIDRAVPCQVRFSRPPVHPFHVPRLAGGLPNSSPAPFWFAIPAFTRNLGGSISRQAAAHATELSGFGARGGRCGRCVESVLTSPRDGSKLGGQKDFGNTPPKPRRFDLTPSRSARNGAFRVRSPWRVVADAAWNRFCTSRRDGRRLGGRKDFGNTPPNRRTRNVADVKSGSPVLPSSRSPVPRSASRGRVAQFVSSPLLVCDSGLHAKPRRFDLTPSRSARNGAFRVRSPWRSLRTLRGIGSDVSSRWQQARGAKGFRQHTPKPRRFDLTPSRSARNGAFRVRSPWRVVADAAWNRFCTSRRDGRRLGGRKDFGNTPPNRRTRNVADVKSGSPVLPSSRSPVPRSASRGRVAQFVSSPLLVCDSGLHAKPRRFDLTPSRRARNGAFRVRSPWRSLQTLRGIGSARLAEMAAGSGGEKTSATRPRIVEPGTLQMSSPVLPSSRPPVLPFSRQPDYEKSRWVSS